jgi:CO dehydrogenase maturation factor
MKIAISGKGGVGKTTLTSLLAYHYATNGQPVLAIDADPSPCLGPALGFPAEKLMQLSPIADMRDLIAERTGTSLSEAAGSYFKLNPRVSDIPDRFSQIHNNIRLLLLGAVQQGGAGCICPASALLKQLIRHVMLQRNEIVLLDLYAGVEHLGRGTADAVDVMLAVAEPTHRSLRTVEQIRVLAADIGVDNLLLVGNKAASADDSRFFADHAPGIPLIGCLNASAAVAVADRSGQVLYELDSQLASSVAGIAAGIERHLGTKENQRTRS